MAQVVYFDAGGDTHSQGQNPPAGAQQVEGAVDTIEKLGRNRCAVWAWRQSFGVHESLKINGSRRDDDEIFRFQYDILVRFIVLEDIHHIHLEGLCRARAVV
jgi:hypothetical protein